jgi:hypothetical protein
MELFRDHTYLCSTPDEYKQAIEKALLENNEEKENNRIHFARSHSWENNAKSIYKYIIEFQSKL